MDSSKWKSVAVKIGDYKVLKALCNEKHRSPNSMITKLVNDYCKFRAQKLGISIDKYKDRIIKNANK